MISTSAAECIFCRIIAGESPASVFYEDDLVLGLMTIGPVTTVSATSVHARACEQWERGVHRDTGMRTTSPSHSLA